MRFSRILGFVILIAGIAALLFSNYITTQVKEGKIKVNKGQKAVDQGNQLFSLNPVSKQVGKSLTDSAQKSINEGVQKIAHYENIAQILEIGGIAAIILGGGMVIFSYMGNKRKRH